jgi:hypothetical protein
MSLPSMEPLTGAVGNKNCKSKLANQEALNVVILLIRPIIPERLHKALSNSVNRSWLISDAIVITIGEFSVKSIAQTS